MVTLIDHSYYLRIGYYLYMEVTEKIKKAAEIIDDHAWINVNIYDSGKGHQALLSIRIKTKNVEIFNFMKISFTCHTSEQIKNGEHFYWWNMQAGKALLFLKRVYPYLKKKKEQVDLVFEMQARKKFKKTGAKLPEEELLARKALSARIREFNEIS